MKIYGDTRSGNCLKVKYTADFLGLDYEWIDVDVMAGESRNEMFLGINPMGQVPAIALSDGRKLAQSNAIISFLAEGTLLLPDAPFHRAKVNEILFWEQYSHEPYIAVCRFHMLYMGKSLAEREPWRVERGEAALDFMEARLLGRDWFVGDDISVADIALLAYTRLADEGGFSLELRPNIRRWIKTAEDILGI